MRRILGGVFVAVAIVTLGACGGGSSGSGSTGDFCTAVKADQAGFEKIGGDPSNAQFQAALNDLAKKAPSEIKADMTTLVNGVKASQDALSQLSADPSKADSIESAFSSQLTSLQAAATHIETFVKDKCGIDISGSGSDSSS